jgi:hypothetical protein
MATTSDGGPGMESMKLRDFFAALAMQGLLSNGEQSVPCILIAPTQSGDKRCMTESEFADLTYAYADAMLKAREQ